MVISRQPACVPPIHEADLPADLTARDDVIRHLLNDLIGRGLLAADRCTPILEGLFRRESIGSTAIGHGVAIPHLRVAGLPGFLVLHGHSQKGVSWPGARAGQSVHCVYLVLSPNEDPGGHLRLLEHISRVARDGRPAE